MEFLDHVRGVVEIDCVLRSWAMADSIEAFGPEIGEVFLRELLGRVFELFLKQLTGSEGKVSDLGSHVRGGFDMFAFVVGDQLTESWVFLESLDPGERIAGNARDFRVGGSLRDQSCEHMVRGGDPRERGFRIYRLIREKDHEILLREFLRVLKSPGSDERRPSADRDLPDVESSDMVHHAGPFAIDGTGAKWRAVSLSWSILLGYHFHSARSTLAYILSAQVASGSGSGK